MTHYSHLSAREMDRVVRDVFGDVFVDANVGKARHHSPSPSRKISKGISQGPKSFDVSDRSLLDALDSKIAAELEVIESKAKIDKIPSEKSGKLGPPKVHFDVATHVGSFIIGTDRVGVGSQSHFSSIKANVCIFKGKWQYEVLLGSKGVMQVGWCTRDCQFSEENGVGDTADSYSYDGNRVRKWNVSTYRYGEPWLSGDIIGVTLDCDENKIEFFRNGRSLGVAFDDVKSVPGLAYFPGVSLGDGENLVANFGATPFKHPVQGFVPLQDPPGVEVKKATMLMNWLDKLLEAYEAPVQKPDAKVGWKELPSRKAVVFLVGSKIFRHLSQLLIVPYVVESVFMPFLQESKRINACLTLMWALMEEHELIRCLEYVCISLLTRFRQSASGGEFPNQKLALRLLGEILSHQRTRKLVLKNVFFERIRFPTFMHLKPLDDEALKVAVPKVHWEGTPEEDKAGYEEAIAKLKSDVGELETLQLEVLRLLLTRTDGTNSEPSSRSLFLVKIRRFIRENVWSARIPVVMQTPTPVMLCFFHRLLTAYLSLMETDSKVDDDVHVPLKAFCDDSLKYFDCNRLGGAYPYLKRTHRMELAEFLGPDYVPPPSGQPETS